MEQAKELVTKYNAPGPDAASIPLTAGHVDNLFGTPDRIAVAAESFLQNHGQTLGAITYLYFDQRDNVCFVGWIRDSKARRFGIRLGKMDVSMGHVLLPDGSVYIDHVAIVEEGRRRGCEIRVLSSNRSTSG